MGKADSEDRGRTLKSWGKLAWSPVGGEEGEMQRRERQGYLVERDFTEESRLARKRRNVSRIKQN